VRPALRVLLVLLVAAALAPRPLAASGSAGPELVVFAAASLREAFAQAASSFEKDRPGVHVRFNFAGSQELRTQLEQGAMADVFASADEHQMEGARAAGLVEAERILATNAPVVIVPRANPAGVRAFAELPRARRLVIGAPEVPIGRYTLQILDRASQRLGAGFRAEVEARVVSRELNVKQVLAKVALGEADAGIVYATDARAAADRVTVVAIPAELNVVAVYPIAVLRRAPQPALAQEWLALLGSPEGQTLLAGFGFGPPPAAP